MSIELILTSAAVGGIAAAVIGQIGQHLERKQKTELADLEMKKLLFTRAVDLALEDRTFELELAKATKIGGGIIPPSAVTVTKHFEYLTHIFNKGTVPDEVMATIQKQVDEHNGRLLQRRE